MARAAHNVNAEASGALTVPVGGDNGGGPSSSLPDCLGRVRRVKAKPHAVASRALTQRPRPEGWQLSRRTGEDRDAAISAGRTAVRRAISVPLTPVTSGLSRSLADTPTRRSGHATGPDGTASQADSAGSIPVTRSRREHTARAFFSSGLRIGSSYRPSTLTFEICVRQVQVRQLCGALVARATIDPKCDADDD